MAPQGPFGPPQGSGTTFERFHFDRFWARLASLSPGSFPWQADHKRAQTGKKRRPRRPHRPQKAFFRALMPLGRIAKWWNPTARNQGTDRTRFG